MCAYSGAGLLSNLPLLSAMSTLSVRNCRFISLPNSFADAVTFYFACRCIERPTIGHCFTVAAFPALLTSIHEAGLRHREVENEKAALVHDLVDGVGERWIGRLVPAGARGAGTAAANFFAGYIPRFLSLIQLSRIFSSLGTRCMWMHPT